MSRELGCCGRRRHGGVLESLYCGAGASCDLILSFSRQEQVDGLGWEYGPGTGTGTREVTFLEPGMR